MTKTKKPTGFSAMDPERAAEIHSLGGKTAHAKGHAHEWNHETASAAGKKSAASRNLSREHMAELGRLGAAARQRKRMERIDAFIVEFGGDEENQESSPQS